MLTTQPRRSVTCHPENSKYILCLPKRWSTLNIRRGLHPKPEFYSERQPRKPEKQGTQIVQTQRKHDISRTQTLFKRRKCSSLLRWSDVIRVWSLGYGWRGWPPDMRTTCEVPIVTSEGPPTCRWVVATKPSP